MVNSFKEDHDFFVWCIENFPYALHMNPDGEYSDFDMRAAKKCFIAKRRELERFTNQEYMLKAFACLIFSINKGKEEIIAVDKSDARNNKNLHSNIWGLYEVAKRNRLVKRMINVLEAKTNKRHFTLYRGDIARSVDEGLNWLAPGNNLVIIGYLLHQVKMIEFSGPRNTGEIRIIINRV